MARDAFPTPHDWKEGRRRAWALAQQGWPQHLIAAALGVTPDGCPGSTEQQGGQDDEC